MVMEGDDPIEVDQGLILSINLTVHNHNINDTDYNFTAEPVTGFRVAFRPTSLTVPVGGSGSVNMIIWQLGAEAGSSYTFTVTVTDGCASHSKNVSIQIPVRIEQCKIFCEIDCHNMDFNLITGYRRSCPIGQV